MSALVSNTLYELSSVKSVRVATSMLAMWFIAVVWLSSDAGMGLGSILLLFFSGLFLTFLWVAQLIAHLRIRPKSSPERRLLVKLHPVLLGVALLFCLTQAPFYIRFYLSKSALSVYATTLNEPFVSHQAKRVGLFVLRETEAREGNVRFITSQDGLMDDAGLVFAPNGAPERSRKCTYTHLSGPWWHWHRRW